jgi:hypothetical protein
MGVDWAMENGSVKALKVGDILWVFSGAFQLSTDII